MAQQNKDLLSRLADRGEQVVGKIGDINLPGAKGLMERTTSMAKRIDDLQKHVRSLDPLVQRVTSIEKRLDKLEGKTKSRPRKAAPEKRTKPASTVKAKPTATPPDSPS